MTRRRLLAFYLALCVLLGVASLPAAPAAAARVCRMTGRPMAALAPGGAAGREDMAAAHHACCRRRHGGAAADASAAAALSGAGCCCKVKPAPPRTTAPALAPSAGSDGVAWFVTRISCVAPVAAPVRAAWAAPRAVSAPRAPPPRQSSPRAPPSSLV